MAEKLPPSDHVVRYVRKRLLRRDDKDTVIGVLPQAFQLRDGESYLSVTWVEHFSQVYDVGFCNAAAAIGRQLTVKGNDGFTAGQVGGISDLCDKVEIRVRLLHEPEPPENTGHSAIRGLPRDNMDLLALLADDVFVDTRLAHLILAPPANAAG